MSMTDIRERQRERREIHRERERERERDHYYGKVNRLTKGMSHCVELSNQNAYAQAGGALKAVTRAIKHIKAIISVFTPVCSTPSPPLSLPDWSSKYCIIFLNR